MLGIISCIDSLVLLMCLNSFGHIIEDINICFSLFQQETDFHKHGSLKNTKFFSSIELKAVNMFYCYGQGGQRKINNCQINMLKNQKWCTNFVLIATRNKNIILLTPGVIKMQVKRGSCCSISKQSILVMCCTPFAHIVRLRLDTVLWTVNTDS